MKEHRKHRLRLAIARAICQPLPPVLGFRLSRILYPRRLVEADDTPWQTRACTGSVFCGTVHEMHSYYFGVYGYFEWRNWAIALALCESGDTIVEVGANIGTETVGFRDIVGPNGRVVCFEPVPANCLALERLVSLNRWKNVQLKSIALGAKNGTVRFALPANSACTTTGHLTHSDGGLNQSVIDVNCTKLDLIAEEVGPAKVLFIDAEGSDADVLVGGTQYIKENRPSLVVEAGPSLLARAGWTIADFLAFLRDSDYDVYRVARYGCIPIKEPLPTHRENWLCLDNSRPELFRRVNRSIQKCAFIPCVRGLNPLRNVRSR